MDFPVPAWNCFSLFFYSSSCRQTVGKPHKFSTPCWSKAGMQNVSIERWLDIRHITDWIMEALTQLSNCVQWVGTNCWQLKPKTEDFLQKSNAESFLPLHLSLETVYKNRTELHFKVFTNLQNLSNWVRSTTVRHRICMQNGANAWRLLWPQL